MNRVRVKHNLSFPSFVQQKHRDRGEISGAKKDENKRRVNLAGSHFLSAQRAGVVLRVLPAEILFPAGRRDHAHPDVTPTGL